MNAAANRAADGLHPGESTFLAAIQSYLPYAAWAVALAAMAGSLYFSEVRDFPPCALCWYQRILMYPLTVVLAVAILRRDTGIFWTVLPLSFAGIAVSTYHNLIQQGVISETIKACQIGVSCRVKEIEWLGFITIPMMSLTAFILISILITAYALGGIKASKESA